MATSQLISVNFNLRSPKAKQPTPLYMVVYYLTSEGKAIQAKIPTGKKILPTLWDSRKQQPILTSIHIDLTNKQLQEQAELTAFVSNCRILVYSNNFTNFENLKEIITQQTDNDMTVTPQFIQSKKTPKATKMIEEVLTMWEQQGNLAKNTINTYRVDYKKWCKWLTTTNQIDSAKALSQVAFNSFKDWMIAQNESAQNVNTKCRTIARITKELVNGKGAKYGIKEVTFKNLPTISKNVKCELLEEEIEALKQVATETEKETFSRNVFLLQLSTGQRISDAYTILKGEYTTQPDGNGNEFIIIKNKKGTRGTNDKKSYIPMTKEVSDLLQVLQGSELLPKSDNALKDLVNRNIKVLAERAGLDRITKNGKPLCEKISNHYARHTQATRLARNGMTSEQIALQLGNSKEMVERVYTHPTDTDIINKLSQANTPAPAAGTQTAAGNTTTAVPAVAKDKDLEYYNNLSDDDKLLYTKKLNDYNVLKDDFFSQLERQTERKRKATAEAKTREILQVWGFEGANNMNYKKLCFLLDLIKHDINDFILTYKVYNEKAPQGSISAINEFERLIINIGKLASYL